MTPEADDSFQTRIRHLLRTQNNRVTSDPVFIVEQRRRIWGAGPEYTETFAWVNADGEEVDAAMAATLEAGRLACAPTPEGYRRVGYFDTWEFVTPCLTEAGAQAYIDANGHNLRAPRIYVSSGWRNEEWIKLRSFFMAYATERVKDETSDRLHRKGTRSTLGGAGRPGGKLMEKRLLRKLRALQNMDSYSTVQPPPGQDPMETLLELLEAKRTALAESLLKIAAERWTDTDSLLAIAKSCNEAAGVIYPELPEPEGLP